MSMVAEGRQGRVIIQKPYPFPNTSPLQPPTKSASEVVAHLKGSVSLWDCEVPYPFATTRDLE